ncbi:sodium/proton-translocating pyrophosphatase, partial [Pseudomonadota bacterium]
MTEQFIPVIFGVLGLVVAWFIYRDVLKYHAGEGKVLEIAEAIHQGAMVFMRREYTVLTIFIAVVAVLLILSLGVYTTIAFLVGAFCSGLAG